MQMTDPKERTDDFINNLLRLGFECNEKCVFCNFIPETEPDVKRVNLEEAKSFIERFAKTTNPQLSISGGEPTLRKELPELISYARSLGIPQVQIQTNATLITEKFAQTLKEAGLTEAFVAFHSHVPEIQDWLTGLKGSFEKAVNGIKNCLKVGI
ncbi:MAG: radical SAM protein, partial [bacterium]